MGTNKPLNIVHDSIMVDLPADARRLCALNKQLQFALLYGASVDTIRRLALMRPRKPKRGKAGVKSSPKQVRAAQRRRMQVNRRRQARRFNALLQRVCHVLDGSVLRVTTENAKSIAVPCRWEEV